MNRPKKTIILAAIGLALLGVAGAGFATAHTATLERDSLAYDMQAVRNTVIPHSFAFTEGVTGPKRDKETVLWVSAMAKAAGVKIGDEVTLLRPVAGLNLNSLESYNKYGWGYAIFWNKPGRDGYHTITLVLPRDLPMIMQLKHPDGTTSEIRA